MNWFGKMLDLPKEFLNESEGPGGGVLQVLFIKMFNNCYTLCSEENKEFISFKMVII